MIHPLKDDLGFRVPPGEGCFGRRCVTAPVMRHRRKCRTADCPTAKLPWHRAELVEDSELHEFVIFIPKGHEISEISSGVTWQKSRPVKTKLCI